MYTKLEIQKQLHDKELQDLKQLKDEEREFIRKAREAIDEMARFDASKKNAEKVLEVLIRCSKAIASLKDHWKTLSMFFVRISNEIHTTLTNDMNKFKDLADATLANNKPISTMAYKQLIDPAQAALKTAYCVEQVSLVYGEISQKHFIPMVNEFSKLLALDAKDDIAEIHRLKRALNDKAEKAVKAIEKKTMSHKDELAKRIHVRSGTFIFSIT